MGCVCVGCVRWVGVWCVCVVCACGVGCVVPQSQAAALKRTNQTALKDHEKDMAQELGRITKATASAKKKLDEVGENMSKCAIFS